MPPQAAEQGREFKCENRFGAFAPCFAIVPEVGHLSRLTARAGNRRAARHTCGESGRPPARSGKKAETVAAVQVVPSWARLDRARKRQAAVRDSCCVSESAGTVGESFVPLRISSYSRDELVSAHSTEVPRDMQRYARICRDMQARRDAVVPACRATAGVRHRKRPAAPGRSSEVR